MTNTVGFGQKKKLPTTPPDYLIHHHHQKRATRKSFHLMLCNESSSIFIWHQHLKLLLIVAVTHSEIKQKWKRQGHMPGNVM